MHTQDYDTLMHALEWCRQGLAPWLCTIVKVTGSSPRPVGSMLACLTDGRQAGSISGGCVEEDLLDRLHTNAIEAHPPQLITYGVTPEENVRLGLPCGGRLQVLVQRLGELDQSWLAEILAALDARRCIERHLSLESGDTQLISVEHFTELAIDPNRLRQCLGPRMRMLLVGAGQLAQRVAELALSMDYEVLVTDTRQGFLDQWEGPQLPLLQGMPDDIVRTYARDRFCIVITLTHDPRVDDMALMEALTTEAWYVGALGSMRTTAARLDRLRQLDLSEAQIARLHAPVGLDIGSKTPIEIAVAIMAELTALRRKPV